jgi:hypothetical protein
MDDTGCQDEFLLACESGDLARAKRVLVDVRQDRDLVLYASKCACEEGHLPLVMWLTSECGVMPWDYDDYGGFQHLLFTACADGHVAVAQWLCTALGTRTLSAGLLFGAAYRACCHGHLLTAKWLDEIPFTMDNTNERLRVACTHGRIRVAKWLVAVNGRRDAFRRLDQFELFSNTCDRGDLITAQWLMGTFGTTLSAEELEWAFYGACSLGHLHVAAWLHALGAADGNFSAFQQVCRQGALQSAKWLHALGGVDIHANADAALVSALDPRVGRWLVCRDPEWPWPEQCLQRLQVWSPARDAWIKAVVYARSSE